MHENRNNNNNNKTLKSLDWEDRMRVGCAKMSLWQLIVCFFRSFSSAIHFNYITKLKLTKMW